MTIHDPLSDQASPVGTGPSAELGTGLLEKILHQQAGSHDGKTAVWESPLFWKALAKGAGLLGASIGALVLLGWMLDISALKSINPNWIAMKANTALCFVLSGLALWLKASDAIHPKSLGRAMEQVLSGIVVLLGLFTLLEYLANIDLGIDQWLFLEAANAIGTLPPGRMAPATALCFILLGSALLLDDKSARNRSLSATLAVMTAIIALISGLIYLYNTDASYGLEYTVQLAANTVLAFSLLALGLLCAQPEHGVVALLRRRDSGGAITRSLLPITLFLPILLGWLKLTGERYDLYEPDFGVALVALSYIVILTTLVLWSARFLSRVDSERGRMNAVIASDDLQLRTLLNTIPDLIWLKDINGIYLACNPAFEHFFGAQETEIIGKTDYDFVPREQADFFRANDQSAISAGKPTTNEEWLTFADNGQRILAETTKMPMFDQQGKLLGVLCIARDITAHHLAAEQLRQAKIETDHLLAESNQSKQALLSVLEDNKATTRALQLSHERYAFLFNAIADAVYVHEILESGAPSRFLEVNEVACLISGYTREELLEMTPLQLDAPDSGVDLAPVIQRLMAGESATFEQTHLCKNGQRIPVEIHSHLFKLDERPAVISIVRDITERKRTEDVLKNSEERYRTMIENSNDMIWTLAPDGKFTFINQQAEDVTGRSIADWLGEKFTPLVVEEDLPMIIEIHGRVLRGEKIHYEIRGKKADGGILTLSVNASPIFKDGKVNGTISFASDITERKLAEQKLAESELHFRSLFENMLNGYAYCHMRFNGSIAEDFTYLAVNKSFETLTGLKDVVGKYVSEVIPGIRESDPELFVVYGRVALSGLPESFETYVKSLGIWFSIAVYSPKKEYFVAVFDNITERKQAEMNILQMNRYLEQRVLDRTAQLAASNKELEAFSYSVSHDLRAPLRSIAGFVELLRKQGYACIDDKGRHYMDVISGAAVQMGKLIDDILTFSRIGRVEMTLSQVNLNQVLSEVQNTLRPQTEGRQIEWNIAPLPEVNGERTLLSLVLLNLLSNALKFTQTRDMAKIEIGTITGNPGETVCYVKDNGVGFDMRHMDKLFGLFQRLHAQEEFEGTGVGLANVQRIVQRHGGRVWAEGKVNAGATFYFALPKSRAPT